MYNNDSMFSQTKKKLFLSILLPTISLFLLVFFSISVALTSYNREHFIDFMNNEIHILCSKFSFNIQSLSVSNESILQSDDIAVYLSDGSNESLVKTMLSGKVVQNSYSIGCSLYPLPSSGIAPVGSMQIGGLAEAEDIYGLTAIREFLDTDDSDLLFIRREAIHYNYDFYHYDPELGLMSLVNKIFLDGSFRGLLFTDFSTDKIYKDILPFESFRHFERSNIYLEDRETILKKSESVAEIDKEGATETISGSLFSDYRAVVPLRDSIVLLIQVPYLNVNLADIVLTALMALVTVVLTFADIVLTKNLIRNIIHPLESLNEQMLKDQVYG